MGVNASLTRDDDACDARARQYTLYDIATFAKLLPKRTPSVLKLLFTPDEQVLWQSAAWAHLVHALRPLVLCRPVHETIARFLAQAAKRPANQAAVLDRGFELMLDAFHEAAAGGAASPAPLNIVQRHLAIDTARLPHSELVVDCVAPWVLQVRCGEL